MEETCWLSLLFRSKKSPSLSFPEKGIAQQMDVIALSHYIAIVDHSFLEGTTGPDVLFHVFHRPSWNRKEEHDHATLCANSQRAFLPPSPSYRALPLTFRFSVTYYVRLRFAFGEDASPLFREGNFPE